MGHQDDLDKLVAELMIVANSTWGGLLAERGAVGDICLHYYDAAGNPVLSHEEDPVIGMELSQIRECNHVIALAGGVEKQNAIRGALQGNYIDVLITDYPTARSLVEG